MPTPRHRRSTHRWPSGLALGVVTLAYLALCAGEVVFIKKASANIPISDTWGYVGTLVRFTTTGHIAWGRILRFYGDGRPTLERFGLLLDAEYFVLNVQYIKVLAIPVGMLETACAIVAVRFALPRSRLVVVLLTAFPIALAIFCWSNWQNFLDEWNLMNLAAVALSFLAIVSIVSLRTARNKRIYFLPLAIIVCAIASFTGESGTLSWVVCGLVLWLPLSRCRLVEKLVFSGIGIAFLGVYFSGAKKVASGHPLQHLGRVLEFALSCLGNNLIDGNVKQLVLARAVGIAEIVVVAILVVLYLKDRRLRGDRAVQVAAGLITFALMGALATGVSRSPLGINTAMSSRYLVLTLPVVIGIYLVLVRLTTIWQTDERRAVSTPRRTGLFALPCLLAAIISVVAIASDVSEGRGAADKRSYYLVLQKMACNPGAYSTVDLSRFDHSGGLRPRQKKLLLVQIADLKRARLSVFSDGLCKSLASSSSHKSVSG